MSMKDPDTATLSPAADAAAIPAVRPRGILERLRLALAIHAANRRLRRASRRYRSGNSPPVPSWLREDLGLPPEHHWPPLSNWWELR